MKPKLFYRDDNSASISDVFVLVILMMVFMGFLVGMQETFNGKELTQTQNELLERLSEPREGTECAVLDFKCPSEDFLLMSFKMFIAGTMLLLIAIGLIIGNLLWFLAPFSLLFAIIFLVWFFESLFGIKIFKPVYLKIKDNLKKDSELK